LPGRYPSTMQQRRATEPSYHMTSKQLSRLSSGCRSRRHFEETGIRPFPNRWGKLFCTVFVCPRKRNRPDATALACPAAPRQTCLRVVGQALNTLRHLVILISESAKSVVLASPT